VIESATFTRLIDYANGFMLDLPVGTVFDFSKSPNFVTAEGDSFSAVISREWSAETFVCGYIAYYFNRFLLDERFLEYNGIRLLENYVSEYRERITVVITDWPKHLYNSYTYFYFKTGTRIFYRVMVRYRYDEARMQDVLAQIEDSFEFFRPMGRAVYDVSWYPVLPGNWTPETVSLYNKFLDPNAFMWGIFVSRVTTEGIAYEIPEMERFLGQPFDIVLAYVHLDEEFPTDFMERCYNEGRITLLTYQFTETNNHRLYGTSPIISLIREGDDVRIRDFARAAADFGRPFLFRLNNEMNSDWVSYGGVNNLLDPGLFIEAWRMVYRIFYEEGVTNAIWVWNPQDKDAPPNNWNSFVAYYPGNEYVHILGVTGYNTGTFYADIFGEVWREFRQIYDFIAYIYDGLFDSFPWIITEFASSSIGGDKVRWIDNMFRDLHRYPQIRAAVWFSYADWDFRLPYGEVAARPYWLDETEETLEAFRRGLMQMRR